MKLLVGTAKGLIVYQILHKEAPMELGIHFLGYAVNTVFVDERHDRWWVGVAHRHWGQKLHYSDDQGAHWSEASMPSYRMATLLSGEKAKLRQIWSIQQGGNDQPNRLWIGTEPGGLFESKDRGLSFELNQSLWNHPSRKKEGQWFGAGSDFPFIHSIVVNPVDSNHVYIAVSCAGVFESKDGGLNWIAKNNGLLATYLPNPKVEVGHDPHQLLMHSKFPDVLWQQNHCGIFFSKNGGDLWSEVFLTEGVSSYGFSIAIDEEDPAKCWVIPVESDQRRIAPNLRLEVFETCDFGATWNSESKGLPTATCFDIVLRKSFVRTNKIMVFGTTNGNIYYSLNEKNRYWQAFNTNLTKVNSVILY
jgi:ligand-binding sensor domain-containing protein